jgi:two-component system response regulator MprA
MRLGRTAHIGAAAHGTVLAIRPSDELLQALRVVQSHRHVDLVALSDSAGLLGAHVRHRPDLVVAEIRSDADADEGLMRSLRGLHEVTRCLSVVIAHDPQARIAASAWATQVVTPPVGAQLLLPALDAAVAAGAVRGADRPASETPPASARPFETSGPTIPASTPVRWGPFSIDASTRLATCDQQDLPLTRIEFDLLMLFVLHPLQVLTRSQIVDHVWGAWYGDHHHVDVHLSRLRRKIARASGRATLPAVRGVGFRLLAPTGALADSPDLVGAAHPAVTGVMAGSPQALTDECRARTASIPRAGGTAMEAIDATAPRVLA